jgi:hypothetical protein
VPPEKPGIIIETPIAAPFAQFDKKFLILFVFMWLSSFIYYKCIDKIIKEKVKKEEERAKKQDSTVSSVGF